MKTTHLSKFKWGRKQQQQFQKILICIFRISYCSALKIILELLNMQSKYIMLIYAFLYPIYIKSLFKSELRWISYELNHFSMQLCKLNANNILNILNMGESNLLWN